MAPPQLRTLALTEPCPQPPRRRKPARATSITQTEPWEAPTRTSGNTGTPLPAGPAGKPPSASQFRGQQSAAHAQIELARIQAAGREAAWLVRRARGRGASQASSRLVWPRPSRQAASPAPPRSHVRAQPHRAYGIRQPLAWGALPFCSEGASSAHGGGPRQGSAGPLSPCCSEQGPVPPSHPLHSTPRLKGRCACLVQGTADFETSLEHKFHHDCLSNWIDKAPGS
ncbi:uncharacterized protein LOC122456222 [Dermochelys coriacea]|uniref:uncharacterized protein LOC122456222 n=1 Tax=Dermochelys coriacea TaxID=27794 RepID=UPI001CA96453|nr:uncharacterized protein LOC122456222 [Dermochelys coriacea]